MNRALLIGVEYGGDTGLSVLPYCENDVKMMEATLKKRFGFSDNDIKKWTGKDATKQNIVNCLRDCLTDISKCQSSCSLIFYFSGFGTIVGETEALLPYDVKLGDPSSYCRVKEIEETFKQCLPTSHQHNIMFILDTSFPSGMKYSPANNEHFKSLPPKWRSEVDKMTESAKVTFSEILGNYATVFSACNIDQMALSLDDLCCEEEGCALKGLSAFTWALCYHLLKEEKLNNKFLLDRLTKCFEDKKIGQLARVNPDLALEREFLIGKFLEKGKESFLEEGKKEEKKEGLKEFQEGKEKKEEAKSAPMAVPKSVETI